MKLYPKPELETDETEAGYIFSDCVDAEADLTVSPIGVLINTTASGDVFFSLDDIRALYDLIKAQGA